MRRVLFLAYHFPPVGGGGVQRNAKFARHLPGLGYEPVVVTGSGEARGRWTPYDESLLDDVPDGLEIRRISVPEPAAAGRRRARAGRWLGIPTPFTRWWLGEAVSAGLEVGRSVDLVSASLAPYETAYAAARLARALGKPWVADLQDPWALDEIWFYPTGAHRRAGRARMRRVLASAAAIVMNSPEAEARLRHAFPELDDTRIVTIPNGFDAEDFAGPPPARRDGAFRIVHAGYLHTESGLRQRGTGVLRRALGGASAGVDLLSRSHVHLLAALERLAASGADLSTVEVHLAGVLTEDDRRLAASPLVRLHGYLPHSEAVELVRSADLLFLPLHDVGRGRAGIVPGKTYEYLASGRPLLAALPAGDARDLLAPLARATLCAPSDVGRIADAVAAELRRHREHGRRPSVTGRELAPFERSVLAARLASVFDDLLANARPTPADHLAVRRRLRAATSSSARAERPEKLAQRP